MTAPSKSLRVTQINHERARDGGFRRRGGYAGRASSASRFTLFGPAWLSFGRHSHT